jgi:hypothetical protein
LSHIKEMIEDQALPRYYIVPFQILRALTARKISMRERQRKGTNRDEANKAAARVLTGIPGLSTFFESTDALEGSRFLTKNVLEAKIHFSSAVLEIVNLFPKMPYPNVGKFEWALIKEREEYMLKLENWNNLLEDKETTEENKLKVEKGCIGKEDIEIIRILEKALKTVAQSESKARVKVPPRMPHEWVLPAGTPPFDSGIGLPTTESPNTTALMVFRQPSRGLSERGWNTHDCSTALLYPKQHETHTYQSVL